LISTQRKPQERKTIKKDKLEEKLATNCEGLVWILEEEHEETNGPETKMVKPGRESLLQFTLIDEATPIPVHHLKAGDHVLRCPRWKS